MTPTFCPQCGRQLPAADLIHASPQTCPGCGYAVRLAANAPDASGDDDSATRPVPREVLAATTPSALAASAPPSSGVRGAADALDGATQPAPPRLGGANAALTMQTADLPPQLAPAGAGAAPIANRAAAGRAAERTPDAPNGGASGDDARRRRPWVAISIVALIVILLATALVAVFLTSPQTGSPATGAHATPTTAPAPTATPVSSLPTLTFTKAGLYRLNYPAAWLVRQQNNAGGSLVLFSGQQSAGVNPAINIQVIPANESVPDMATRDDDILKTSATGNSIHNQTGPTSVRVGGQSWTQMTADVTLTGPTQTVHEVVLSVAHGQNVYSITYLAAATAFAGLDTAAFQPALATFTFLS
ncbi:MAG TPA: zinc ribbon domain-containing protein [Ktedonobacterales bacterium]|nr:zinc ribbon domain-containing protein [Ktedonobacterales bacterium]